ncbi:hypothetical protein B0A48_11223 [Cryoendolithus antarcticus]|uniref:Uncharacterized protein n=1 Tax=Cryoendolithus antarcticus TaxID=1507870 RepID=A0A1V8SV66_9PEZI|nr:hypothetical protein B0A48_11223 [Cryoendolithus antarcticus]
MSDDPRNTAGWHYIPELRQEVWHDVVNDVYIDRSGGLIRPRQLAMLLQRRAAEADGGDARHNVAHGRHLDDERDYKRSALLRSRALRARRQALAATAKASDSSVRVVQIPSDEDNGDGEGSDEDPQGSDGDGAGDHEEALDRQQTRSTQTSRPLRGRQDAEQRNNDAEDEGEDVDTGEEGGFDDGDDDTRMQHQLRKRDDPQQHTATANSGNNAKPRSNTRNIIKNGNNSNVFFIQENHFHNYATNPDQGNQSRNRPDTSQRDSNKGRYRR